MAEKEETRSYEQIIEEETKRSEELWDEAVACQNIVSTGKLADGSPASKSAINKAKKRKKQARSESEKAADVVKKYKTKMKNEDFKKSVKGDIIVDEEGNFVRKYSLGEKFFDNKILSYGVVIIAIGLLLGYMFWTGFQS